MVVRLVHPTHIKKILSCVVASLIRITGTMLWALGLILIQWQNNKKSLAEKEMAHQVEVA